jgi:hypothetical protein
MCFFLAGSSTDASAVIDGQTIQTVIDRIRVLSGSVVLCDISECSLLFQSLYDVNTEVNLSSAQKYTLGDLSGADKISAFALAAPGRQYIAKIAPRGSLMNCDALLPIGRCSDITIELTFATGAKSIYSPANHLAATWTITSFELHLDYIQSPTISAHFNSNPFRISCVDYSQRLNSLLSATTGQIRWSSANTSLDKVYTILRDGTTSQAINTQNKARVALAGNLIVSYNILANNQWFYADSINGGGDASYEQWQEFLDAYPQAYTSSFFTTNSFFSGTQNRLAVNFESAPAPFRKELLSGQRTRDLNSDIILQIVFTAAQTCRVDSFLCSSATVSLPRNMGDLKIEY